MYSALLMGALRHGPIRRPLPQGEGRGEGIKRMRLWRGPVLESGLSRPRGEVLSCADKKVPKEARSDTPPLRGSLRYSPKPALGNSRQTTPLRHPSLKTSGFGCVARWRVSRTGAASSSFLVGWTDKGSPTMLKRSKKVGRPSSAQPTALNVP